MIVTPTDPMGQWIEVNYKLKRVWHPAEGPFGKERKSWTDLPFKAPIRVMICGERVLSNGTVVYGGYDKGTEYNAKEHFKALMVTKGLRSKPFFVRSADFPMDPLTGRVTTQHQ